MKTLFIDRKQCELEMEKGRITVRIPGQRPNASFPVHMIEFIVVSASVEFSSGLLARLTQEGITVLFINPRKPENSTMTLGLMHNNAERRLRQYGVVADPARRLDCARRLVTEKLRHQRAMLGSALRKRPDNRYAITKAMERLTSCIQRTGGAASIESLRGLEGAGAAGYFEAYRSLFAPALGFNGRNRRPPRDPVNVALSLTYTLLHAQAIQTLFGAGFDPLLGVYHEPEYGRESAACDLVELFRPQADKWVWRLFADGVLRPEHFISNETSDVPCIMGKAGRELYYMHYEFASRAWRRLMRRVVRAWLAELMA